MLQVNEGEVKISVFNLESGLEVRMWLISRGRWVTIVIFVLQLTQIYCFFTNDQTVLTVEQLSGSDKKGPSCSGSCCSSVRSVSEVQNCSAPCRCSAVVFGITSWKLSIFIPSTDTQERVSDPP